MSAEKAKKAAKKKAAPAKKAVKKPVVQKPVKKAVAKKPAVVKAVKKPVASKKPVAVKKPTKKSAAPAVQPVKIKFSASQIKTFRQRLQELRDHVVDGINFLAGDNLTRSQRDSAGDLSGYSLHMADQGTDNFDREFALNQLSGEQDVIYEIDEALQRLADGSYGICEDCGCAIATERLLALPFARRCVKCKAVYEKVHSKFRPLGPPLGAK